MLFLEMGCTFNGIILVDKGDNVFHLLVIVAEFRKCFRYSLIDNFYDTAAHKFFILHQCYIGFDTRGITIHHKTDRPCRS